MPALAFDTHKAVKTLKAAGANEILAEAVVSTVGDAIGGNVATKADLVELQATTKADLAELQATTKATLRNYKPPPRLRLQISGPTCSRWRLGS